MREEEEREAVTDVCICYQSAFQNRGVSGPACPKSGKHKRGRLCYEVRTKAIRTHRSSTKTAHRRFFLVRSIVRGLPC